MKPFDLHNHSIISKDGCVSEKTLIDIASSRGMKGLGISDHDEFFDESLYAYARSKGLLLALGIEFTCTDVHIIGYNLSFSGQDRQFLEKRFDNLRENYFDSTLEQISVLRRNGFQISLEDLQAFSGKSKPHKIFIHKFLAEQLKLYPSWNFSRADIKSRGLYVKDGTDFPIPPVEIIDLIHRSDGFAIWAHPFITSKEKQEHYLKLFQQHKIDAVEASYAYHENGYPGKESNAELEAKMRAVLSECGILVSGGSDSHYPFKTYSDLYPITPGDFGITEEEAERMLHIFR